MSEAALEMMMRQFGRHAELDEEDRRALTRLPLTRRTANAGAFLLREGEPAHDHLILVSGFAQRHKLARSGGRQIVAIQIPGEAISCSTLFFGWADHSTQALTPVEMVSIPRDVFRRAVLERPRITEAIMKTTLLEASISNEWLLNMGRRPAKTRVAHLLCEMAARIDAAGISNGTQYDIPLTQEQIGDALGLTAVHVNRMLKELNEEALVFRDGRRIKIPDRRKLEYAAEFTVSYLHIDRDARSTIRSR
ncbi:Crp/Fnr family transcriptional regulator [Sphingomonas sp. PsM26]|nr:Crp/Fnr family transcriptional regulator [Sphingomonas sp. PsM26]